MKKITQEKAIGSEVISEKEMLSNPILTQDLSTESIPGNMRRATHFLPVLRKLIVFFKDLLNTKDMKMESPLNLVYKLQNDYFIDQRTLKFTT